MLILYTDGWRENCDCVMFTRKAGICVPDYKYRLYMLSMFYNLSDLIFMYIVLHSPDIADDTTSTSGHEITKQFKVYSESHKK